MQAIVTKYHGPTNLRGSRISAKCERGRISIPYPHELKQGEECHRAAAAALIARFIREDVEKYGKEANPPGRGWLTPYVSGGLPDGTWAHVFIA